MIRLLAFDLDGTSITQHKYLSPKNREALLLAQKKGVVLVPATGRMRDFLPEEVVSLPGIRYAVTSNGAAVYDLETGKPLRQRLIPNGKAQKVQELLDEYGVYTEYYRDGRAVTKKGDPERAFSHFGLPESKRLFVEWKAYEFTEDFGELLRETGLCPEKINLPYLPPELRQTIWDRLRGLGGLLLTSSLDGNIEINSGDADKGAAVVELAAGLGISREEIMAVGDNGNDLSLLRAAGYSVAVGDGTPEARAAAQYETAPHDQDGLALAIQRFILSP